MKKPFITAVITCGGSSTRMRGVNKIFKELGGIPAVCHSLLTFQKNKNISAIVVTVRDADADRMKELCREFKIGKLCAVVSGGDCREASVLSGVENCPPKTDFILVHDGARPFVTAEITDNVCRALTDGAKAVSPAVPLKDTAVLIDENDMAAEVLNRPLVRLIQTPEGLDFKEFKAALIKNRARLSEFTDDCSVLAAEGIPTKLVEGDPENIKLTTPEDIIFAEAILENAARRKG